MPKHVSLVVCLALGLLAAACGGTDEPAPPSGPACTLENCASGCCANDSCLPGMTASACGTQAGACASCQFLDRCTSRQQCEFIETVSWKVQPLGAIIARLNPRDGTEWDPFFSGDPDVYVKLSCPSLSPAPPVLSQTPEVSDFNPTWTAGGCTTSVGALLASPVEFTLLDADVESDFGTDDLIATLSYTFTRQDFERGSVTLDVAPYASALKIQLTRMQ